MKVETRKGVVNTLAPVEIEGIFLRVEADPQVESQRRLQVGIFDLSGRRVRDLTPRPASSAASTAPLGRPG